MFTLLSDHIFGIVKDLAKHFFLRMAFACGHLIYLASVMQDLY